MAVSELTQQARTRFGLPPSVLLRADEATGEKPWKNVRYRCKRSINPVLADGVYGALTIDGLATGSEDEHGQRLLRNTAYNPASIFHFANTKEWT